LDSESVAVTGPLTDTQLAARLPVTATPRVSITRPADTAPYANGDAWSSSTTVPAVPSVAVGRVTGGTGQIIGMKAICSANQSTKPAVRALVFDTTFTALEDNAAVDLSDAEAARLVGIFDVVPAEWVVTNAAAGASGNLAAKAQSIEPCAFACLAGSQNLYVAVQMLNAYTPTSEEILTLIFDVIQD
jgi:hypothetical protein